MDGSQFNRQYSSPFAWFRNLQLNSVIYNGIVPEWFHGIISRKTAEELLLSKPSGYFLIRVSESRFGYTLSYQAEGRCRHFMIDVLQDGGYIVVGDGAYHQSLQDLVDFHRRSPIKPFKEVLTVPCGQISKDKTDYAELLLFQKQPISANPPPSSSQSNLKAPEVIRPVLPHRSATPRDFQLSPPNVSQLTATCNGQSSTLYPCLEDELSSFSSHIRATVDAVKPVPLPRRKFIAYTPEPDQPPEVPARNILLPQKNETCTRTSSASGTACNTPGLVTQSTGWEDGHPHDAKSQSVRNPDGMPSVVSSILIFKKKFQKRRRSTSQEHLYTEIHEEDEKRSQQQPRVIAGDRNGDTEHEYQELACEQTAGIEPISSTFTTMGLSERGLPVEYLPPPPFAPGY